jgi:hypothetical protein
MVRRVLSEAEVSTTKRLSERLIPVATFCEFEGNHVGSSIIPASISLVH